MDGRTSTEKQQRQALCGARSEKLGRPSTRSAQVSNGPRGRGAWPAMRQYAIVALIESLVIPWPLPRLAPPPPPPRLCHSLRHAAPRGDAVPGAECQVDIWLRSPDCSCECTQLASTAAVPHSLDRICHAQPASHAGIPSLRNKTSGRLLRPHTNIPRLAADSRRQVHSQQLGTQRLHMGRTYFLASASLPAAHTPSRPPMSHVRAA